MLLKQNYITIPAFLMVVASLITFHSFGQKDNEITSEEKKAGWKLLFDGQSITGWRTYNNEKADSWEVLNGELYNKKDGVKKRADIITVDQYDNFELLIDWKVAKGANSGLMYRVIENDKPTFESGPEYQLIDDEGYADKLEDWQKSGADYAMHAPSSLAAKPVGEYNQTRLVVDKGHVEHWLNGKKVAEFELWTPEWQQLKEKSKWKDAKNYGMAKAGYIALQDHGGGVWFKNIKIRKL